MVIFTDPPAIERVRNFSMCQQNQLALLECVFHNPEEGLAVRANWSTVTGKAITSMHLTGQNGSMFYLLLYNATPGEYTCHVFSDYSPQQPEDSATAAVEIIPGEPELAVVPIILQLITIILLQPAYPALHIAIQIHCNYQY